MPVYSLCHEKAWIAKAWLCGPTAALSTLIITCFWCSMFVSLCWMFWKRDSAKNWKNAETFYFVSSPTRALMSLLLVAVLQLGGLLFGWLLSSYDLIHLSVACSQLFNWAPPLGLCTTLMQMQFMVCQFLAQRFLDSPQTLLCFAMQKSVFCDKLLCLITHKCYPITIMLINVICFFCYLCVWVWARKITCAACHRLYSPPREIFHLLRNEPHIWLLCTYYSQWPTQRFAHSFRPSASQCLLVALIAKPHTYIPCFSFSSSLFPLYFSRL